MNAFMYECSVCMHVCDVVYCHEMKCNVMQCTAM